MRATVQWEFCLGKRAPDAAVQRTFNQLILFGRGRRGNGTAKASHPDPSHALQRRALRQGRKCKKLHSHFLPILQPAEAQASFHGAGAVHPVQSHQDRAGGIRGLGKGDGMDPKYETAGRGSLGAQRRCAGRSEAVQVFPGKRSLNRQKPLQGQKKGVR